MNKIIVLILLLFPWPVYANISATEIVNEINTYRNNHKIGLLKVKKELNASASERALYLVKNKLFTHDGFGFTVYKHYKTVKYAGENLAEYKGTSQDIVDAWIASPAHLKVLSDKRYKYIGIGITHSYTPNREMIVMHVAY